MTKAQVVYWHEMGRFGEAESEFVVRWSHSCQEHPLVIEEVRRILVLQVKETGVKP